MKSTILLHCALILWFICWGSLASATDEDTLQNQITAAVMTEKIMNQRSADSNEGEALSRADILKFATAALKKIKEQENNPDDHVANDENSPSRSAQPIEDISFTAKERVTKAREEQQRRDAEIYLRKGTFELMVDQMQHDLAPFLLLIPPPVKAYVKNTSIKLAKQGKSMLTGALFPMAMTGIKVARAGVELVNSLNNIVDMTTQKTRLLLDRVEENYVKAHEEKQNAGKRTHEGDDGVEYGVEVAGEVVGDHDEHDNSHISVDRSDMSAEQEDGGEVIDL